MNQDETELRRLILKVVEEQQWAPEEIQRILLEIAKDYVWKQGLWARVKFTANVVGLMSILGIAIMWLITIFGFDVVRK